MYCITLLHVPSTLLTDTASDTLKFHSNLDGPSCGLEALLLVAAPEKRLRFATSFRAVYNARPDVTLQRVLHSVSDNRKTFHPEWF